MRLLPLLLLAAGPVAAQRLPPAPPRYAATFRGQAHRQSPPLVRPGDHAWEGAKVGAFMVGLGGAGVAYALCSEGDDGHPTNFGYCAPRALVGTLAGATLGAVIGGFIGSAFPRSPPP